MLNKLVLLSYTTTHTHTATIYFTRPRLNMQPFMNSTHFCTLQHAYTSINMQKRIESYLFFLPSSFSAKLVLTKQVVPFFQQLLHMVENLPFSRKLEGEIFSMINLRGKVRPAPWPWPSPFSPSFFLSNLLEFSMLEMINCLVLLSHTYIYI